MTDSPYDAPFTVPVGENVFSIDPETGAVTARRKPPEYRSSIWKDARRILSLPDSAIELLTYRPHGVEYYRIEDGTVKWNPKTERFFCGKPGCGVRGDCPHSRRLKRFREEHPVERVA